MDCAIFCSPEARNDQALWAETPAGDELFLWNSSRAESNNAWLEGTALAYWLLCSATLEIKKHWRNEKKNRKKTADPHGWCGIMTANWFVVGSSSRICWTKRTTSCTHYRSVLLACRHHDRHNEAKGLSGVHVFKNMWAAVINQSIGSGFILGRS